MGKKPRLNYDNGNLYVKTKVPSVLFNSITNKWNIKVYYRSCKNKKYELKQETGYPSEYIARKEFILFRNALENGDRKLWVSYCRRHRELNFEEAKLFAQLKSIDADSCKSKESYYVPKNAAKKKAFKKLNRVLNYLNVTNEEKYEMRSKLLSCEHKKWGIEYIRQMKICSNYYRSILDRIKLALFENKCGTNYIHERIKSFQTKLATYETAYAALLEVIEENKSYLFIIANSANNVDPFSPSDFSIKQLDRVRLQCKLILKLLKRLIDRQIVLLNKTRLALTEIENGFSAWGCSTFLHYWYRQGATSI